MKEIVVDQSSSNQKIDKFVRHYLSDAPLSFIYKIFRKKDVKVNGHWVDKSYLLKQNDIVRIYVNDSQLEDFSKPKEVIKQDFPFQIIYEDENILIVNKPKGVLVIGDDKGNKNTLSNAVLNYLFFKDEFDPNNHTFIPSPAHRLDRNTSGLVLFGKNPVALHDLTELFKTRDQISKYYIALVNGVAPSSGEINKPLKKDPSTGTVSICSLSNGGKTAITKYKLIQKFSNYSLVEIDLITGRTHQIRVHMASIGHPIVGDNKYGNFSDCKLISKIFSLNSQFLHAKTIRFGQLTGLLNYLSNKQYNADLPLELTEILEKLEK